MGGGSVIQTLRNEFKYAGNITAVEIDPIVFQLAQSEFGLIPSKDLILLQQDALDYMRSNKEKYDCIVVDIFLDTIVPEPFMQKDFWIHILEAMNVHAKVIFNFMDPEGCPCSFKTMLQYLGFDMQEYTYVLDTNSIMILSA
jgi:spermidine synthase